jgi:hypothetical protein
MTVAAIRKPAALLYIALAALPGIVLAAFSVQGQVGLGRTVGLFFLFFFVGAVIAGAPLAGMYWLWVHRRAVRERGLFE